MPYDLGVIKKNIILNDSRNVLQTAKDELEEELFREKVDQEKSRMYKRKYRSFWNKFCPFKIIRKENR